MTRELRVGALVLIAIAALGYMFSRVSATRSLPADMQVYYARVKDATGLLANASVRVAGIDVGRVREKKLQNNQALLKMEIATTVEVHSDASLTLRSVGYLGDRYLDLEPGTEEAPVLPPESFIRSREGATLESLMNRGEMLMESWTEVARRLSNLIGG